MLRMADGICIQHTALNPGSSPPFFQLRTQSSIRLFPSMPSFSASFRHIGAPFSHQRNPASSPCCFSIFVATWAIFLGSVRICCPSHLRPSLLRGCLSKHQSTPKSLVSHCARSRSGCTKNVVFFGCSPHIHFKVKSVFNGGGGAASSEGSSPSELWPSLLSQFPLKLRVGHDF